MSTLSLGVAATSFFRGVQPVAGRSFSILFPAFTSYPSRQRRRLGSSSTVCANMGNTARADRRSASPAESKSSETNAGMSNGQDTQEGENGKEGASEDNGDGGSDDWKHRAPYRIHEPNEHFESIYEASCHCGRVQYELNRERPLDAKYCHCETCQRLHGAPFQWAAIFHKTDINFRHGHHDLVWYDPGEKTTRHKLPCKISCAYCRTPIMDEGRNMILLYPTLIKFRNREEKARFAPSCHMFYGRRVVDIADGKPKWSGLNKDSELLDEDVEHGKAQAEVEMGQTKKRKLDEAQSASNGAANSSS